MNTKYLQVFFKTTASKPVFKINDFLGVRIKNILIVDISLFDDDGFCCPCG